MKKNNIKKETFAVIMIILILITFAIFQMIINTNKCKQTLGEDWQYTNYEEYEPQKGYIQCSKPIYENNIVIKREFKGIEK